MFLLQSPDEDFENFNSFLFYYDPPKTSLDDSIVQAIMEENANENKQDIKEEENNNPSVQETAAEIKQEDITTADENNGNNNTSGSTEEWTWVNQTETSPAPNVAASEKSDEVKIKEYSQQMLRKLGEKFIKERDKKFAQQQLQQQFPPQQPELDDTLSASFVMNDSVESDYEDNNHRRINERYLKFWASFLDDKERVPSVLVEFFISMARLQSSTSDVGPDIDYHCAFSFPAVVLTLGRTNWPRLKYAYQELACAHAWKVRSTLASSIHEIAVIIERDNAATDLVPIFDGFIKDLEEVRICALKHFYLFLAVLSPQDRMQYLPKLNDFLITDNKWNWRLRHDLVTQLAKIIPLYEYLDVAAYIAPLLLHLMQDKVAAVREVAIEAVSKILCIFCNSVDFAKMLFPPHTLFENPHFAC